MTIYPVYLDNHATTAVDPRVVDAMMPYWTVHFGNPGSIGHQYGEVARKAVEDGRQRIARVLGVEPDEVIFTSGATESNNLAIRGLAERFRPGCGHLISMSTEHKGVLDPLARCQRWGFEVTLLSPVQIGEQQKGAPVGWLDPLRVSQALRSDTRLVSIMLANNEIGVVQSLGEIVRVCHERNVLVHCDATQGIGKIPVNLGTLDIDLVSFSGHKIYGPRGMGVLIVRRRRPRIKLIPLIDGGGQEQGLRSGTLNVPGIVGLATALEICESEMPTEIDRLRDLRRQLFAGLESFGGISINGPEIQQQDEDFGGLDTRLPGNLNISVADVDGEALMMHMRRIAVSSGSACTSANPSPSHVLRGIGLSDEATRSSLRFGIGRFNTVGDIQLAMEEVGAALDKLRKLR